MSTTKAISANPIRNNGGTVLYGGSIDSSSAVTNAPTTSIIGFHVTKVGATVPKPTATSGTYKPITAGVFANQEAGQYTMIRASNKIAGLPNTLLNSGASGSSLRSINFKENRRTTLAVTAGWNYATGQFLTTPSTSNDNFGLDHAARPTRAIPGELVYHAHSPAANGPLSVPKQDDYKPRTG